MKIVYISNFSKILKKLKFETKNSIFHIYIIINVILPKE